MGRIKPNRYHFEPLATGFDAELNLELAEHAYLRSKGWDYGVLDGDFAWKAPDTHKGLKTFYNSRAPAINSCKRWNMNNRMMRLKVRGEG